jgi:hypothetical protein
MNTNGHYHVWRAGLQETGEISRITCAHCPLSVSPRTLHRAGDKSGLGRYNRARAIIVKHLHAEHRNKLAPVASLTVEG